MPDIRWHTTARYYRSYIIKLTILSPAIGYLIVLNQELSEFTRLISDSEDGSEISLRLFSLFFGLTFIGISSGIFEIFCPIEIKNSATDREFVESESPIITPNRLKKYAAYLGVQLSEKTDRINPAVRAANAISFSQWKNRNEEEISDVLVGYYTQKSKEYPVLRVIMFSLYIFGWLFVLAPTAVTVTQVAAIAVCKL